MKLTTDKYVALRATQIGGEKVLVGDVLQVPTDSVNLLTMGERPKMRKLEADQVVAAEKQMKANHAAIEKKKEADAKKA